MCPANAAIWNTDGSQPDVQAKVNSAARGDTVLVPAGTFSWTSTLSLTKGINLQGAGRDSTFIIRSSANFDSPVVLINPDLTAIYNEETVRVGGFTFDGSNNSFVLIRVNGTGPTGTKPFKNLVVGNCRFRNMSNVLSGNGVFYNRGQVRGLIYGNIFDRCDCILKVMGSDVPTEWANGYFPQSYGTSDNLYFEGNTIQYSSSYGGDPAWFESGQGSRYVIRYNTFDFTNAACTEYWDVHGFQGWPGLPYGGETGTMVAEFYGNTLTKTSGYRWIAHRGGWGLYFNNILTGANGGTIQAWDLASSCEELVPGAPGVFETRVNNTYCWNNTKNGTIQNMVRFIYPAAGTDPGGGCVAHPVLENQQFYNYNASFDGSVGIGRGTSAPTMSATNGVAYWVNNTPTPTTDPNIVQAGHLWKRVGRVWVDYYHPYIYPHPLAAGDPTPSPSPPAPPRNLRVVPPGP